MSGGGRRRAFRLPRFGQREIEREVDDELTFHIRERAERLRAQGWSEDAACAEANRRFGNVGVARAACIDEDGHDLRRERVWGFLDAVWSDLRFAVRSYRRAPALSLVAFLTLTGGIAALTSMFSYYNAIEYARLPYHDVERLVAISEQHASAFPSFSAVSAPAVSLLQRSARSFDRLATYSIDNLTLTASGKSAVDPLPLHVLRVDTAFLPLFDIRAELGRSIAPEEITAGAPRAMISDLLWRSRFGANPAVIGTRLTLSHHDVTVVGVLPPGFRFPWQSDVVLPLRLTDDTSAARAGNFVSIVAKLRPGVRRNRARAEVSLIGRRLVSLDRKTYAGAQLLLRDEPLDRRANNFAPIASLFGGAALLLLLIACANVANLLLSRAAERRAEMAVRASLGASRARLVRQMLTESLLLSTLAAATGAWLSLLVVRVGLHFIPMQGFPSWFHVRLDVHVLLFTTAVAMLVAITAGLTPARDGTRFDLVRSLKAGGDSTSADRTLVRSGQRALAFQLAFSVVLSAGALLMVRSYARMAKIDLGYPADQIAMVTPSCETVAPAYDPSACMTFDESIVARATGVPGIASAAVYGYFGGFDDEITAAARRARAGAKYDPRIIPDRDTTRALRTREDLQLARQYIASDDYFRVLGIKLRAGRAFGRSDVAGSQKVTVISASAARALWGTTSPVGHVVRFGGTGADVVVIGVVDDIGELLGGSNGYRFGPGITFYLSSRQAASYSPEILARGPGDVLAVRRTLLNMVHVADPTLPIFPGETLAHDMELQLLTTRIFGGIIAALAAGAVVLSIIGIYGVVAFGIARRTREIGVRIAIGATPSDVLRLVMLQGFRFVGIGIVAGLLLAVVATRAERVFLFEVSPLDPVTFAVVPVLFALVALVACYLPARRATRIDPLVALRSE